MRVFFPTRPGHSPGGRISPTPRQPGDGAKRYPREVGEPRTVKPRGPMRPTVRPSLPRHPLPLRPNMPTPWWQVGLEMMASAATVETAVAAVFLGPMAIMADHYLDRKDALEKKPLFTPCGSEPHLREREILPERRLSDMERLRRNLRWYADDDLIKEKLLDRDIDALKRLIVDIDRKNQMRDLQTRLNNLNPGSAEAQQLRHKIENLNGDRELAVASPTAARAQAGDGAATSSASGTESAGEGEKKKETLDELLAAIAKRQTQLRPKSVLPVRVDDYVRKIFASNPEGARLMVRLALANDDDMESIVAYARSDHIPPDADLVRLSHFLMKMENQGTRVTGEVLWTMTSAQNRFVQNIVLQSANGAIWLDLHYNWFYVARPGTPVQQVNCSLIPKVLVDMAGVSAELVKEVFAVSRDIKNRSFSKGFHLVFPTDNRRQYPPIDKLVADVVLPSRLDHLQISYVRENPDGELIIAETRSLSRPVPRDLPHVTTLAELDQLLADVKFENSYDEMLERVATKTLAYPSAASFRYSVSFDPQKVPIAIRHIRKELLTPAPLLFDISPGNRELVAMANLKRLVRSSAMETALRDDAMQRQIRADVQLLTPTVIQWIDDVQKNGRHFWAIDTYLALVSSGLLAVDPKVVDKILPDSDRWTAKNQRFVYRLLLDHDTPQAIVMNALSKLHPVIMTDLNYVKPETPVESVILILGGIEVLAQWQDLSGAETKSVADKLRDLMRSAPTEVQKHALQTYVKLVQSGYLSDADLRAGLVEIDALAEQNSHLEHSVRGALLVLGSWVPRDAQAFLRVASAEVYLDAADTPHPIPIGVLRTPFISVPQVSKPSWSQVWSLLDYMPEMRDPDLSKAARAFSVPFYALWSPLLDEAKLAIDTSEKVEEAMADPTLDTDDRTWVEMQRDVVIDFLTSQRRRQLWLQIAVGNDAAAKTELVALLEQRLKEGGTANELSEIQQVRNVALGLPELSFDTLAFEREYLKRLGKLDALNQYHPVKWGKILDLFVSEQGAEVAYCTSVLMYGNFFKNIPHKLQQLVALRVLWNVGDGKLAGYYDALYHAVSPLLASDDPDVAYAAAMTANQLQQRGAHGVDVELAHLLIASSVWERLASGNYKGEPDDMVAGLALLAEQNLLTDAQIDSVLGVILQVLKNRNEITVRQALDLYISLLETHQDAVSKSVDIVALEIARNMECVIASSLREVYLDALERLAPYIPFGQKTWRQLHSVYHFNDLAPWAGRVRNILDIIESQSQ